MHLEHSKGNVKIGLQLKCVNQNVIVYFINWSLQNLDTVVKLYDYQNYSTWGFQSSLEVSHDSWY